MNSDINEFLEWERKNLHLIAGTCDCEWWKMLKNATFKSTFVQSKNFDTIRIYSNYLFDCNKKWNIGDREMKFGTVIDRAWKYGCLLPDANSFIELACRISQYLLTINLIAFQWDVNLRLSHYIPHKTKVLLKFFFSYC
jgi:hypothetical protein